MINDIIILKLFFSFYGLKGLKIYWLNCLIFLYRNFIGNFYIYVCLIGICMYVLILFDLVNCGNF